MDFSGGGVYLTLADFRAAIRGFFNNLQRWKAELASILANKFHIINAEQSSISTA